jgi:diguanylate cyclase
LDQTDNIDFSSAARDALRYLRSRLGFELWMVTRAEGEHWVVLETEGDRYGITPYASFQWKDSFCYHMVTGQAPRIAPDSDSIPAYASARIGRHVAIGAYIGVPLTYQDGALFGTLCAIDPLPQPAEIEKELLLVEVVAKMLSGVLAAELRAVEAERLKERELDAAETDPLTGLSNRDGWERMLRAEERRCKRYCNPAFIVLVDLDGLNALNGLRGYDAGDKLIRRAARVIRKTVRDGDLVARLGGDQFGILGTSANPAAEQLLHSLRRALERGGVRASLGMCARVPVLQLNELCLEARQLMYGEKAARRLQITAVQLRNSSRSQTFPL